MANTLFTAKNPAVYNITEIYDPDDPKSTGTTIPVVNSLIIDTKNGGILYYVSAVDTTTFKSTFVSTKQLILDETYDLASTVSYKNDVFRLYYDTRTSPTSLNVDSRCFVVGTYNGTYQLIRYPGTAKEIVISKYYDTNGNFTSNLIPLAKVDASKNIWYCTNCHTVDALEDEEMILLKVYDDHGALATQVTLHTKRSTIINELPGYTPTIVDLRIDSSQSRSNDEIYIFEKQDVSSLNITATLVYDDGHETLVDIDNTKCFIYGLEDFVSSYSGLQQKIMVKYFLGRDEPVDPNFSSTTYVYKEANLVVVSNELAAGIKLSVIPMWNSYLSQYVLKYYYYTTDRNIVRNVTPYVKITTGTFVGNSYGTQQSFQVSLDMREVEPTLYKEAATFVQSFVIRLQPVAALERYTIRDSLSSLYVYGADNSTSRRPILKYDPTLKQYYIPSSVFKNKEAFLVSFYEKANPPYLPNTEIGAITPTHFVLRDVNTGVMITALPIAIDDYAMAFNIIGTGEADRYVGSQVIVEFLKEINMDNHLILYGVPVDVYEGSGYIG